MCRPSQEELQDRIKALELEVTYLQLSKQFLEADLDRQRKQRYKQIEEAVRLANDELATQVGS